MKVLIVDDVAINRMLPKYLLQKLGHETLEADSGQSALQMLEQDPSIDHILLDINMPEMSGAEVCRRLRAAPGGHSLHIVAYTAHAFPHEKESIMDAGFDDLLIKPITRDLLIQSMKL